MSAYLIYHYNIVDRSRIDELGPLVMPLLAKYNGEIAIGDYVIPLEGEPYSHLVAYKFESQKIALDFYHSEEHKRISRIRNKITNGVLVMVPEFSCKHEFGDNLN